VKTSCRLLWFGRDSVSARSQLVAGHAQSRLKRFGHFWDHLKKLASVFHLGKSGDSYFYAMEFVDGESLDKVIRRSGPLDPSTALKVTALVAAGLEAIDNFRVSNIVAMHGDHDVAWFDVAMDQILLVGFDRTSFHGFLAKRLLLRGGRLLKHIGVAAVVAAPEISGCGFPAQVAINTLRFEDLKTLMAAMVEATQRNEVGALNYEWAISDD